MPNYIGTPYIDTAAKAGEIIVISKVRLLSSGQNVQQPHAEKGVGSVKVLYILLHN